MNARLKAFQQVFSENRRPKFEYDKSNRSMSPKSRNRQNPMDYTFNIKLEKSSQGKKQQIIRHDTKFGLDNVVKKILKAPASEQQFTPLERAISNDAINVKFRDSELIDLKDRV